VRGVGRAAYLPGVLRWELVVRLPPDGARVAGRGAGGAAAVGRARRVTSFALISSPLRLRPPRRGERLEGARPAAACRGPARPGPGVRSVVPPMSRAAPLHYRRRLVDLHVFILEEGAAHTSGPARPAARGAQLEGPTKPARGAAAPPRPAAPRRAPTPSPRGRACRAPSPARGPRRPAAPRRSPPRPHSEPPRPGLPGPIPGPGPTGALPHLSLPAPLAQAQAGNLWLQAEKPLLLDPRFPPGRHSAAPGADVGYEMRAVSPHCYE
ncbi:hypothetical protein FOCC_FOCC012409, partial [Frankliniella occidentalis]